MLGIVFNGDGNPHSSFFGYYAYYTSRASTNGRGQRDGRLGRFAEQLGWTFSGVLKGE